MPSIAFLCGAFHKKEVDAMLTAAKSEAAACGLSVVRELWIPGSMEAPLALDWLLFLENIDAVVILGIIEKGETLHGDVMGHAVTRACIDLSLKYQKPIGLGIIGPGALPEHLPSRLEPFAKRAVQSVSRMLELKKECESYESDSAA